MKKVFLATLVVALVSATISIYSLKRNSNLYSTLTINDVEALSMCEGQGGYKLANCQPSKGKTCYAPGGEFWASDCTYIAVVA